MLCFKFEWIPMKIGFFMNFLSCSKSGLNTLYYSTSRDIVYYVTGMGSSKLTYDTMLVEMQNYNCVTILITVNNNSMAARVTGIAG